MKEPRVSVSLHRTELNSLIWLVQNHIDKCRLYISESSTNKFEDILRSLECAKPEFDELDKELQKIIDDMTNDPNSKIMVFDTLGDLNI